MNSMFMESQLSSCLLVYLLTQDTLKHLSMGFFPFINSSQINSQDKHAQSFMYYKHEMLSYYNIHREVFPAAVSQQATSSYSGTNTQIAGAIQEVFHEDKMEVNDIMFNKVRHCTFYDCWKISLILSDITQTTIKEIDDRNRFLSFYSCLLLCLSVCSL